MARLGDDMRAKGTARVVATAMLFASACAPRALDDAASTTGSAIVDGDGAERRSPSGDERGASPARRRTVCLTGAVAHESPSNAGFRALCESSFIRGRIDDCRGGACKSTFGTFPSTSPEEVWDAVFTELDIDRNGLVDDRDPAVALDVLGFSWGGVNAVALARMMHEDPRMVAPRTIARLILIDAYQPLGSTWITPNVALTYSFRHSLAPATDCSQGAPMGPYLGLPPSCGRDQTCFDYDFSLSPNETFSGMLGAEIGHCDVPRAAAPNIAQILSDAPLKGAPRAVPVTR
jgi:hypothetical protein